MSSQDTTCRSWFDTGTGVCFSLMLFLSSWGILHAQSAIKKAEDKVPPVNEETYRKILEHVMPSEKEYRWKKIGWRDNLVDGLKDAKRLQRPILLWVMAGHPLAHT